MHKYARLPLPVGVIRAVTPAVTALHGLSTRRAVGGPATASSGATPLSKRYPEGPFRYPCGILFSPQRNPYTLGCIFPFHFWTCALGSHSLGNATFCCILGPVPSAHHIAHTRCFWKWRLVKKQIPRTSQPPCDHFTFSQTIQKGLIWARFRCRNNTFRCIIWMYYSLIHSNNTLNNTFTTRSDKPGVSRIGSWGYGMILMSQDYYRNLYITYFCMITVSKLVQSWV